MLNAHAKNTIFTSKKFPVFHLFTRTSDAIFSEMQKNWRSFLFFYFSDLSDKFCAKKDKPEIALLQPFFGFRLLSWKIEVFLLAICFKMVPKTDIMFFSSLSLSKIRVFVTCLYIFKVFFPKYLIPILGVIPTHGRTKKLIMVCFEFDEFEWVI
jgi:hypothetical protein